MSRYIDADELLMAFGEVRADYNCFNELERPRYEMWSNAIDFINTMAKSSIDIVRCKECRWACHYVNDGHIECRLYSHPLRHDYHEMKPDDFCSYGEREGE